MGKIDFLCRATDAERHALLPGDDAIPQPICQLDHAITVDAPPQAVRPWLVQMGAGRAGWYSYDRLDHGGVPSARELREELQTVAVGDVFPALHGARDAFILTEFSENRFMVLGVPGDDAPSGAVGTAEWRSAFNRANWTFWLEPEDGGTRLHVRARLGYLVLRLPLLGERNLPPWLAAIVAPPIHFIMQRKQLAEITRRAEGQ